MLYINDEGIHKYSVINKDDKIELWKIINFKNVTTI